MDPNVIATAAKVGNVIESLLAAVRPGRTGRAARRLRVIPYRSLGDGRVITVRGRVVCEAPTTPRRPRESGAMTVRQHLVSLYRAFDAIEVPHAEVEVSLDGQSARAVCDAGGFFEAELVAPVGRPWRPGRHVAELRLVDGGATAAVELFSAGPQATLAIVSDLDDTAMDTNTPDTLQAIRTVLLRSAGRRQPVPGVPWLYTALRDGADGAAQNPVCYLSSGAWNMYDLIVAYLDAHRLPSGAILLNDWGSRARDFHTVEHTHKRTHLTALLSRLPQLPFLLIGDDVQHDPELYASVALQHPGRVPAIWIRAVESAPERLAAIERLRGALTDAGTTLVVAEQTDVFAADAAARGWLGRAPSGVASADV